MNLLSFENPVFRVYALAAAAMIAKMMSHSYITVFRMLSVNGGFRNPEDTRKTLMNPNAHPDQIKPNEYVERSRRMHQNEVENVPLFLCAGVLWVLTQPSLTVAMAVFGTYVVTRFIHFYILMTAGTHDARAIAWTPGSLIIYYMAGSVAWSACAAWR